MPTRCQDCGHRLALNHTFDILENGCQVKIWCVKCGRLSIITNKDVRTMPKVRMDIVKQYENWR